VNLSGILQLVRESSTYRLLRETLRGSERDERSSARALGILAAARPAVVAALQEDWPGPILWVAGSPDAARQNADQVRAWSLHPDGVVYFHAPDVVFYDPSPWDPLTVSARASVLSMLTPLQQATSAEAGHGLVISASAWALMPRSVTPLAFRRAILRLTPGKVISPYQLL